MQKTAKSNDQKACSDAAVGGIMGAGRTGGAPSDASLRHSATIREIGVIRRAGRGGGPVEKWRRCATGRERRGANGVQGRTGRAGQNSATSGAPDSEQPGTKHQER